jgi:hypothetical protein
LEQDAVLWLLVTQNEELESKRASSAWFSPSWYAIGDSWDGRTTKGELIKQIEERLVSRSSILAEKMQKLL